MVKHSSPLSGLINQTMAKWVAAKLFKPVLKPEMNFMAVGQPQNMLLEQFGDVVSQAFGTDSVYWVGSSMGENKKDWRDVDVRVLLTDEQWAKLGLFEPPKLCFHDAKWRTLCIVFSHYGRHLTGLPIDFQIQRIKEANEEFKGGRSHLGTKHI